MEINTAYLQQQLAQLPRLPRYHVAFSGGVDSHVLLHLLTRLREQQPGLNLSAIHVHHGLQAEADDWVTHCQSVCDVLNIDLEIRYVKVNTGDGSSPEAAAREARYQVFRDIIKQGEGLLMAHHQDDQAETILLQLFRGAGVAGLSAMPALAEFASGWLLRPLLSVPRRQIEAYAWSHNLHWIEDPSNVSTEYDRNFLRQDIMPLLNQRWPTVTATLSRAASHQAEAACLLENLAEQDYQQSKGPHQQRNTLSVSALASLEPGRQRNVVRYWLKRLCKLPLPDTRHLQRILTEVVTASEDATPLVEWRGAEVRRYRDELFAHANLERASSAEAFLLQYPWKLQQPFKLPDNSLLQIEQVEGLGLKSSLAGRDDIRVGFRKGGEQCRPVGRGHRHSLKKLMQEWGIPPWLRDRIPLLYVGDEIAQVIGHCLCEPFQANADEIGLLISQTDI